LPVQSRKQAQFLENQSPGKQGKKEKNGEYDASNPPGLLE
jgi:hypothetical protein